MFHKELQLRAPKILQVTASAVCDVPVKVEDKKFANILHSVASVLHGRSAEMSSLHYQIAFILALGGCTQWDIDRLAKCGITVTGKSIHNKLLSWKADLDTSVLQFKEEWEQGKKGCMKYQIVGDNWDKKILPSFRISLNQTISIHLFNVVLVVDRVQISPTTTAQHSEPDAIPFEKFVPSVEEQTQLKRELTFIVATSVISNIDQLSDPTVSYWSF